MPADFWLEEAIGKNLYLDAQQCLELGIIDKSFEINSMKRELKNDMNAKSKNELIRIVVDLSEQYLRLLNMVKSLKQNAENKGTYDEITGTSPPASPEPLSESKDSTKTE